MKVCPIRIEIKQDQEDDRNHKVGHSVVKGNRNEELDRFADYMPTR